MKKRTEIVVMSVVVLFIATTVSAEQSYTGKIKEITLREPKIQPLFKPKATPVPIIPTPIGPPVLATPEDSHEPLGPPVLAKSDDAPKNAKGIEHSHKNDGKVLGNGGTLVARDGKPGMKVIRDADAIKKPRGLYLGPPIRVPGEGSGIKKPAPRPMPIQPVDPVVSPGRDRDPSIDPPVGDPVRVKGKPEIIARFKGAPVIVPLEPRKGEDDASIDPPPGDPVPADPTKLTGRENAIQKSHKNDGKELGNGGTLVAREGRPGMKVVRPPQTAEIDHKIKMLDDPKPIPGDVVRDENPKLLHPTYEPPVEDRVGKYLGAR